MNNIKIWPHDVPDGEWQDLPKMSRGKQLHYVTTEQAAVTFVRTPGTVQGQDGVSRSSVLIRIDVPGGPTVVLETTMYLFESVAAAMRGGEQHDADKAAKATKH